MKLLGVPAEVQNSYNGREEVRGWFKKLVAQHVQIRVKIIKVRGDTVTTRTEIWSDLTRQLGVAPLVAMEVYVVHEGRLPALLQPSHLKPGSDFNVPCRLNMQEEVIRCRKNNHDDLPLFFHT
jgi:hypothetical protein